MVSAALHPRSWLLQSGYTIETGGCGARNSATGTSKFKVTKSFKQFRKEENI
jgi:hypothetical protein